MDPRRLPAILFVLVMLAACGAGGGGAPASGATSDDAAAAAAAAGAAGAGAAAAGGAAIVPGEIAMPSPTLRFLTIEWPFAGDANRDATVALRFRATGTSVWRSGMPLRRVAAGANLGFAWTSRFSGSLFDLEPDTEYEVELSLADPDGGSIVRSARARTRPVPGPMAGAPVRAATPATLGTVLRGAQPGDVIELAAGTYAWPDWNANGTPGKPIVVRSAQVAVIQGEIGLFSRSHVHLDGLVVNGRIRFNGSSHVSITRCTVNASATYGGDAIVAYTRAENAYIADNVVNGLTPWTESAFGASGANLGEGILVTGPGHVIEHNRVRGFRDGISLMEETEAVDQHSIDIVGNDVSETADDAIEADFCRHNCRVVRNRLTNTFVAMSSQPSLGGPTWFVRNVAYNVAHVAFKLYRGSVGDQLIHNTVVKGGDAFAMYPGAPVASLFSRNNLFLGGPGGIWNGYGSGRGDVVALGDVATGSSSLDHDALGSTLGTFQGTLGTVRFASLEAMRATTGERNAQRVDLSVFAAGVALPTLATSVYAPPDLRPGAGSAVAGAAEPLANIGDAEGVARPSIGAYEPGAALPVYGPR